MTNRCDSVDALMYAYYEFMKSKEENQMLEKDKNCIEFSMHSMMATHKPYQEDTEITITGMALGKNLLLANNPFDIPCDVVVVSKRYFERLQTENKELKKKLQVPDPFVDYKELLEKLHSKEDIENFEWTLNHICGGQASVNGWMVSAKLWKQNYETLCKLSGFSSVEEVQEYLTNNVACDTLHEAILKLRDMVEKLKEEVVSWKNVTGYSAPEDYMHARISGAFHTPFDYTAAWQKATGCDAPEAAIKRINGLINEAEAWESDYNHLLALTGFDNEGEIEDFLEENNDRNKLTTVIGYLKLENETMKTALRASNLAMQKTLDSEIDEWQKATDCDSPEAAETKLRNLRSRIDEIKTFAAIASNWTDRIVEA